MMQMNVSTKIFALFLCNAKVYIYLVCKFDDLVRASVIQVMF